MLRTDIPSDEKLFRAWLHYQLRAKGTNLTAIAREIGVCKQNVHRVIRRPSPKIEREIAARLGVHPKKLWPSRYGPDGKPNRKKGRPVIQNTTTPAARRNGKTRLARSQEAA